MFDVFISHSTKDVETANAICSYLESNGLKCWMAPKDITGGKIYAEEIIDGIQESPVFLIILSEAAVLSKHVLSELDTAFNEKKTIIPFCVDDASIPKTFAYYLGFSQKVDGRPPLEEKLEELRTTIVCNIPELASIREKKQAYELIAQDMGWSTDRLEGLTRRVLSKKMTDSPLDQIDDSDPHGRSRYDVLVNDAGEVLLIISARKGKVEDHGAVFVIDSISRYALLYRSHESCVLFDDIAKEANIAIRKVGSLLVVETTDDDVVREYTATVRVVRDVRSLLDDEKEFRDEEDLYEFMDIIDNNSEVSQNKDEADIPPADIALGYHSDSCLSISSDSLLVYQDSGDNVLFISKDLFVVPRTLSPKEVQSILGGQVVRVYRTNGIENDKPCLEDRGEAFQLLDKWLLNKDLAVQVKTLKVDSVLKYLSEEWIKNRALS